MADLCARTQVVDPERKQRREQREHHQSEKPDLVAISFRGDTGTKTVLYFARTKPAGPPE
jgi:hypothetical protein